MMRTFRLDCWKRSAPRSAPTERRPGLAFSLEPEEWVGARWHRWAADRGSDRHYPAAAVALHELRGALGVFFRIGGGDRGLGVDAISARESAHRLSLRQRLGFDREMLERARLDDHSLQLPARIDLLPSAALNRDLYFWLAAYFAASRPVAAVGDPLCADILSLREARRASIEVLRRFPGLAARYVRLCQAVRAERAPRQHLPPVEAELEAAILALLDECGTPGTGDSAGRPGNRLLACIRDPALELAGLRAPRRYHPMLPVPLWGQVLARDMAVRDGSEDEPRSTEAPDQEQAVAGGARKASRRRQEQSERDDPLVFNRFEKLLSIAEMVNLNRLVDDDPDDRAAKSAEQFEELTLSPHARKAASRLQVELEPPAGAVVGERLAGEFTYPEWNYRKQCYLPDQSRVLVALHEESAEPWLPDPATGNRVRRVERQFAALRPRRVVLHGQAQGNELDTDAVVRGYCDQLATGV